MSNGRLTKKDLLPSFAQEIDNTAAQVTELEGKSTELATQLAQTANDLTGRGLNIAQPPFNLSPDGVTDNSAVFQQAIDYLTTIGGGKLIVPKMPNAYVIKAENPTINTPKRIKITSNNIHIEGVSSPTIKMLGVTKAYIESINDLSSSGRDVFTVFSFVGVNNCSVIGLNFEGEWDGTGRHRFASPRAIAVAFKGCTDCIASGLTGKGLLGNLVNAVSSSATYDGLYKVSTRIKIMDSHAVQCYENGFNFMGNTFDCSISESTAELCGTNGFEGGSVGLTVSNCIFKKNKANGIAVSGTDTTITTCILNENGSDSAADTGYGNGLQISYSSDLFTKDIVVNGCIIKGNRGFGVYIYPGVDGVKLSENIIKDNSTKGAYNYGVYIAGTTSLKIKNIDIKDNTITDSVGNTVNAILLGHVDNADVSRNKAYVSDTKSTSILAMETCTNIEVYDNNVNKPVVVYDQALNCVKYNNFGSSPKISERTSAPTVGTWKIGDRVKNTSTSELGETGSKYMILGWICTVSGSPGTWIEHKVLTGK